MSRHFLNEFIRLCLAQNYYVERAGPATYPLFIRSLQVSLAIFTGLCLVGVLLSLARGRLHAAP